jgi:hypothetical protein
MADFCSGVTCSKESMAAKFGPLNFGPFSKSPCGPVCLCSPFSCLAQFGQWQGCPFFSQEQGRPCEHAQGPPFWQQVAVLEQQLKLQNLPAKKPKARASTIMLAIKSFDPFMVYSLVK